MQEIRNPMTTPSGILVMPVRVSGIITKNSGLPKLLRTSLGPIKFCSLHNSSTFTLRYNLQVTCLLPVEIVGMQIEIKNKMHIINCFSSISLSNKDTNYVHKVHKGISFSILFLALLCRKLGNLVLDIANVIFRL